MIAQFVFLGKIRGKTTRALDITQAPGHLIGRLLTDVRRRGLNVVHARRPNHVQAPDPRCLAFK